MKVIQARWASRSDRPKVFFACRARELANMVGDPKAKKLALEELGSENSDAPNWIFLFDPELIKGSLDPWAWNSDEDQEGEDEYMAYVLHRWLDKHPEAFDAAPDVWSVDVFDCAVSLGLRTRG